MPTQRPKEIDWYQMPVKLRALPRNEREGALKQYEKVNGPYDWKKGMQCQQ